MKLNRVPLTGPLRIIALVACIAGSACQTPASVPPTLVRDSTEDLRQTLVERATEDYDLAKPSVPVPGDGLPISHTDSVRNIQVFAFAMIRRGSATPESPRFVAAILSTRKYKRLGLQKGMNYILKVRNGASTRYIMVPDKAQASMYFLTDTTFQDLTGDAPPHVMREEAYRIMRGTNVDVYYAIGGCIDSCGSGHCGATDVGSVFTHSDAEAWGVQE